MTNYDLWAPVYDTLYTFDFDCDKYLKQAVKCGEGAKILSLCCGTGRILFKLAQAGFTVWGVDLSTEMLAKAKEKRDKEPADIAAQVHFVEYDLKTVKIDQKFAMAYISFLSFHHLTSIKDQLIGLRNIHSHLEDNGIFMVEVFQPDFTHFNKDLYQSFVNTQIPQNKHQIISQRILQVDYSQQKVYEDFFDQEFDGAGNFVKGFHRLLTGCYIFRSEMELLLRMTGFQVERVLEKKRSNPYDQDSGFLTFICRKVTQVEICTTSTTNTSPYDSWEPTYNTAYNINEDLTFYDQQCGEFGENTLNLLTIGEQNHRLASYLAKKNHHVWAYNVVQPPIPTENLSLIENEKQIPQEQKFDLICLPANALASWITPEDQLTILQTCQKHLQTKTGKLIIDLFVPKIDNLAQPNRQQLKKYKVIDSTNDLFCFRYEKYKYRQQVIECDKFYEEYQSSGELVRKFHYQSYFRWIHRNELELLLQMAGLEAEFYSSTTLSPYNYHSGRMIVIAKYRT